MRILSRYFLASYLKLFVTILFATLLAIMVVEMLLSFEAIFGGPDGLRGAVKYLFLRLPSYYLRDVIPVTSFAAAYFCFGLPARAREVTAIKTGGISPHRLVAPILVAAAALSAGALVVNETLVLQAAREWRQLESPGEPVVFGRGSFWYHRGNAIYNFREADGDSHTLYGVRAFDLDDRGRLLRSIRAERVLVDGGRWRFLDATVRRFDPAHPEAAPRVERIGERLITVAEDRDLERLEAGIRNLSLPDLRDYIRSQAREGWDTSRQRAELHKRLAEPFAVLLFALLAVPLGLAVEHTRSLATSALHGVGLVGLFYAARSTATMFATGGVVPAGLSAWLVIAAFGGLGAWRMLRVPR